MQQRYRTLVGVPERQQRTAVLAPPFPVQGHAAHANPRGPRDLVERIAAHATSLLGTAKLDAYRPANHLTGGEQRIPRRDLQANTIPRRLEHGAQTLHGAVGEPLVGLGFLVPPFLPFCIRQSCIVGDDRKHHQRVTRPGRTTNRPGPRSSACPSRSAWFRRSDFQPRRVRQREKAVPGDGREARIAEEA